jgi:hypothetical protein
MISPVNFNLPSLSCTHSGVYWIFRNHYTDDFWLHLSLSSSRFLGLMLFEILIDNLQMTGDVDSRTRAIAWCGLSA